MSDRLKYNAYGAWPAGAAKYDYILPTCSLEAKQVWQRATIVKAAITVDRMIDDLKKTIAAVKTTQFEVLA